MRNDEREKDIKYLQTRRQGLIYLQKTSRKNLPYNDPRPEEFEEV